MKLNFIFLGIIFIISKINLSQTVDSLSFTFGNDNWDVINSTTTDASGNILITGYYYIPSSGGIVDVDPSVAAKNFTKTGSNFFIAKYDNQLNLIWAFDLSSSASISSGLYQEGGITVKTINNDIYLLGYFKDKMDFDPGAGTFYLQPTAATFSEDLFLAKYDSQGNFIWARLIDFSGGFYSAKLHILNDSTLSVYGDIGGGTITFYNSNGNISLNNSRSYNFIVNNSGDALQAIGFSKNNINVSNFLNQNGYYMTLGNRINMFYGDSIFLSHYNNNHNLTSRKLLLSSKGVKNTREIKISSQKTDSKGNIFISGSIVDTCDFDPSSNLYLLHSNNSKYAMFIAKYDSLGNFLFAKIFENDATSINNIQNLNELIDMELDSLDNVYITGGFTDSVYLDKNNSNSLLRGFPTNFTMFAAKFDVNGNFKWKYILGGYGPSMWSNTGWSITIDKNGNPLFSGSITGPLYNGFIGREGAGFNTVNSGWGGDCFLLRIKDPYSISTSVLEPNKSNNNYLSIYPNPNSGVFTIKTEMEGNYSIINELGQTIKQFQLNNTNNYTIDIENLNTGIYFVVGYNNNKMVKQKIVVTK